MPSRNWHAAQKDAQRLACHAFPRHHGDSGTAQYLHTNLVVHCTPMSWQYSVPSASPSGWHSLAELRRGYAAHRRRSFLAPVGVLGVDGVVGVAGVPGVVGVEGPVRGVISGMLFARRCAARTSALGLSHLKICPGPACAALSAVGMMNAMGEGGKSATGRRRDMSSVLIPRALAAGRIAGTRGSDDQRWTYVHAASGAQPTGGLRVMGCMAD